MPQTKEEVLAILKQHTRAALVGAGEPAELPGYVGTMIATMTIRMDARGRLGTKDVDDAKDILTRFVALASTYAKSREVATPTVADFAAARKDLSIDEWLI